MTKKTIDLSLLTPVGKIKSDMTDGVFNMTTTGAISNIAQGIYRDKIRSYVKLPGKYRLPMRIDMRICIDTPEMLLLIGAGHISFGSHRMENHRIEDIAEPTGKPKLYDNEVPYNQEVDISVILNVKEMQIVINGEERYYSTKERYMKSKYFREQNVTGFEVGITCIKRAELKIQSLAITESEETEPFERAANALQKQPDNNILQSEKPTFDSCIKDLPTEMREEIINTERFLKSLKNLKFKRTIEKNGNKITYVESNIGISYALYLSGNIMHHSFQWYLITNGKAETWHRKHNDMESTLENIRRTSPALADRIFYNLSECIGCRAGCLARTPYSYQSQKKITCHGHVSLKMCHSDFQDVRDFFSELNRMQNTVESENK